MAGRGGTGVELDLSRVPLREQSMTPYEILLSESQERMLLVAKAGTEDEVKQIFDKWISMRLLLVGLPTIGSFVHFLRASKWLVFRLTL